MGDLAEYGEIFEGRIVAEVRRKMGSAIIGFLNRDQTIDPLVSSFEVR